MKKLSIITPFYNTKVEYFQKYFDSISTQNYTNIEVLLINDCSTNEDTINLAKSFCQKDNRFKIINMRENSKTYLARMEGIKSYTGDYLTFCDSDDWVTHNFYVSLIKLLEDNNVEMSVGSRRRLFEDSGKLELSSFSYKLNLKSYFKDKFTIIFMLNTVYKRSLIDRAFNDLCKINRKFCYMDDYLMSCILQQHANSITNDISVRDKEFGVYFINSESINKMEESSFSKMKNYLDDAYFVLKKFNEMFYLHPGIFRVCEAKIYEIFENNKLSEYQKKALWETNTFLYSRFQNMKKIPKVINYISILDKEYKNIEDERRNTLILNTQNHGGVRLVCWNIDDFPSEIKETVWFKKSFLFKDYSICEDYLKLWIIYNKGGFYFSNKVKSLMPLYGKWFFEEELRIGLKYDGSIEDSVFGAPPKNKYVKKLLDWYENIEDFNDDWGVAEKLKYSKYSASILWYLILEKDIQEKNIQLLSPDIFSANKKTEDTITINNCEEE
jgi:glycosyltransferase involved in cell wall biosynthesis